MQASIEIYGPRDYTLTLYNIIVEDDIVRTLWQHKGLRNQHLIY